MTGGTDEVRDARYAPQDLSGLIVIGLDVKRMEPNPFETHKDWKLIVAMFGM